MQPIVMRHTFSSKQRYEVSSVTVDSGNFSHCS
uniref:Uncharacterized protein n=1 Tax=Anguilla anguilla TaxID=7936 RepID=A0A0E9R1B5_ANGAN